MVIKNVNLEIVCGITSKIPDTAYNEVAFAGKSNVGKSSLINALMNRKALARTSAQPGKTQTINFYNINDAMYLVDLPGYGYAKASEEVKAKWGKMIENYLHTSKRLKAVFLLIVLSLRRRTHLPQAPETAASPAPDAAPALPPRFSAGQIPDTPYRAPSPPAPAVPSPPLPPLR